MIRCLAALAISASNPKPDDMSVFREAMNDVEPAIRYWGVVGISQIKKSDDDISGCLEKAARDVDPCVRIAAACCLFHLGRKDEAVVVLEKILTDQEDKYVLHFALNVIDFEGPDTVAVLKEPIGRLQRSDKNKNYIQRIIAGLKLEF